MTEPHRRPLRHESLVAWQRADELFIRLHRVSLKAFPTYERFELGGQIRRAAYSVAANIVEGFARRSRRERLHYLQIAQGSLAEVGYCLHVARMLDTSTKPTRRTCKIRSVGLARRSPDWCEA